MQFFDIITALTIGGILAILLLYVVVVYKKGWLKKNSQGSETYFLCPNSKCRRVFKTPIWLTDLSKTPPESYQACPHCSSDLQISPSFHAKEGTALESKPNAQPVIQDLKTSVRAHSAHDENLPESKESQKEVFKPKITSIKPIENPKETPAKPAVTPLKQAEKNVSERPRACSHYFGYVRTLPKNTSIPDECLWCPWIVKCLTGTEKVEA